MTLASFRMLKVTCFLSHMEYRPNTKQAILWKTDHAKERSLMKEMHQALEGKRGGGEGG
jgi:hypothetical protein